MFSDKRIDNGQAFDWNKISGQYAQYRDIYPDAFYEKLLGLGFCTKGQHVLDLGTGTGVLPRNLHRFGAHFTGIDISPNQIEQARRLSLEKSMDDIEYLVSAAEDLSFPDSTFDAVTACQCHIYFNEAAVYPAIHKLLKNGGKMCILFMSWLTEESPVAAFSENLVLKFNPSWTGANMRPFAIEMPAAASGLFEVEHSEIYDIAVPFTQDSWHGRMMACRGMGASSLPAGQIAAFEKEHVCYLKNVFEPFYIPHFVTLLVLRKL